MLQVLVQEPEDPAARQDRPSAEWAAVIYGEKRRTKRVGSFENGPLQVVVALTPINANPRRPKSFVVFVAELKREESQGHFSTCTQENHLAKFWHM